MNLTGYITGFAASLFLTLTAYLTVKDHLLGRTGMIVAIVGLAITQLVVQLIFFLHLGTETRPRWKLYTFWFMLLVVVIVVLGSIWIIDSLNYRHAASPSQINKYIKSQDGL